MSAYQYAPLATGHSIRLLRLLPAPHSAAELRCDLFDAQLHKTSQPAYEALSYTWGNASDTVPMILSGFSFSITSNLAAALRALRTKNAPRTLWVDAVCINQPDLVEQGAQVRMMWDIYRSADAVVVWLGPEVGDTNIAMDNIAARDCSTKVETRKTKREMPRGKCGCHAGEFFTHPSRVGIQQLLDSRWFTRVWVLQEVAAAKRVKVACGNRVVEGSDFHHELISLSSWIASMGKVLRKIRPALELMNHTHNRLSAGSLPILELMERFRSWDATKPVDKLFALLELSSDASRIPHLQPDYTLPAEVLARRIVQFAFSTCVIDPPQHTTSNGTKIDFEIEALFLGELCGKTSLSGEQRDFDFHAEREPKPPVTTINKKVAELFGRSAQWKIAIDNERKLQMGQSVFWLRGASRPTVLSIRDIAPTVVMLATPKPYRSEKTSRSRIEAWDDALQDLSRETEGFVKLKLSWDPFRKPHASELSKHTLTPNDPIVQWEAMLEIMKDTEQEGHNCSTLTMLRMMYWGDKNAIKAGTSKYTTTLHKAAYEGSYGTVKLLLDAKADVNATLHTFGTPLHIAVMQGRADIVQALLEAGADLNIKDGNGATPLVIASIHSYTNIGQMLLNAGATIPPSLAQTERSLDPTHRLIGLAIRGNVDELMQLLESGQVNPDKTVEVGGMTGVTPLHMAAEMGRTESVAALLQAGANPDPRTSTDTTPLHQAAMNGHSRIVKLLLELGANINAQDDKGTTPLDFALFKKRLETAQIIAAAGGQNMKVKE